MKREDAVRYGRVIVFTLSQEKIWAEKTCNYHIYYLTTSYYNTKTSIHHKAFIKLTTCGKHSSLYLLTTNPSIHPNSNKNSSVAFINLPTLYNASKKIKLIFAHIPHPQHWTSKRTPSGCDFSRRTSCPELKLHVIINKTFNLRST